MESGTTLSQAVFPETLDVADAISDPAPEPLPPARRRVPRRRHREPLRLEHCLNCGRGVAPHRFCPACGQENKHQDVSVFELFQDAWDEFIKVDSKLIKTLVPLLFRPGFLTREFISGRRVRYISPFKLYLVVSFFFFLIVSYRSQTHLLQEIEKKQVSLSRQIEAARERQKNGGKAAAVPPAPPAKDAAGKPVRKTDPLKLTINDSSLNLVDLPASVTEYQQAQAKLSPSQRDHRPMRLAKCLLILVMQKGNAGNILSNLLDAASKMIFVLLPVYALLLKLLYLRSGRRYVQHFVYALHLHTFFLCLILAEMLLPRWQWADRLLIGGALVYGFVALRCVYGQGLLKTLLKGILLTITYLQIVIIAIIATVLGSLIAQSGFLAG